MRGRGIGRKTFRTTGDGAGESLSFPVESSEWFGCVAVSEIQLGTCVQHLPAQERGIWSWGVVDGKRVESGDFASSLDSLTSSAARGSS